MSAEDQPTETFVVDGKRLSAAECRELFLKAELSERKRQVLEMIESGRIVDIGCYAGNFAFAALQRFPDATVIGIDYFADHIGIARAVFPEMAQNFIQMSVYDLSFDDNSLDCVTLQEIVEHLEGAAQAVKEINRVLKVGGTAIISVPNPFYLSAMLSFFRFEIRNGLRRLRGAGNQLGTEIYFDDIEWNRHIFSWTPQTLLTLFVVNGFEYVDHRYERRGANWLERLMLRLFPFLGPTQILKVRKTSAAPERLV